MGNCRSGCVEEQWLCSYDLIVVSPLLWRLFLYFSWLEGILSVTYSPRLQMAFVNEFFNNWQFLYFSFNIIF